MKYYDKINSEQNIFMERIHEPDVNSLQFELEMCSTKAIFVVIFDSYVAYALVNESYDNAGIEGVLFNKEGEKIRIYTQSNFLDYLKKDRYICNEYPEDLKHYVFVTANHILNIAATKEPIISLKD